MRAAPATGALYPIELYIVCENVNGLQAGVYHFCPGQFTLTKLREGDYRQALSEAAGSDPAIKNSPFTMSTLPPSHGGMPGNIKHVLTDIGSGILV